MGESLTERCRVVDEVLRHVNTFYEGESCAQHRSQKSNLKNQNVMQNVEINADSFELAF